MAHSALPLPRKPAAARRKDSAAPSRRGLHILPAANAPSKAAATRLFSKFAVRAGQPLGKVRAELIPESSWKRSVDELRPTAAQTVTRLAHALSFATRTWGSEADAIDWLLGPHPELGGATPYSLLRTENGGRTVDALMAALEFGFPV